MTLSYKDVVGITSIIIVYSLIFLYIGFHLGFNQGQNSCKRTVNYVHYFDSRPPSN